MTEWRTEAKAMLKDGYGVEDVAVKTGVDVDEVRQIVRAMRASRMLNNMYGLDIKEITRAVSKESGVSVSEILGTNRQRRIVIPRHEIMRRAYEEGYTIEAIGAHMNRDHTSVSNGIRRASEKMRNNAKNTS